MDLKRKITWMLTPVLILIFALALSACSSSGSNNGATTVNVDMTNFAFTLDKSSVSAGSVTFHVKNSGDVAHEMVVLKTDLDPKQLPTESDGSVDEAKLESKGETEDVAAGATKDLTLTLDAGNYVLLCNLTGHYEKGMVTKFTVK